MAEISITEECLRKQVLRQLLYRRYVKGVDLANIFALQLSLFQAGDETTRDTWQACKPVYLDYVGLTEKELQRLLLGRTDRTPAPHTRRGGPRAHPCDGTMGGRRRTISEGAGIGVHVHIPPEGTATTIQYDGGIMVVQQTDHLGGCRDVADFEKQEVLVSELVISPACITDPTIIDEGISGVEAPGAEPTAETLGAESWRYEALFVCRLACSMLSLETAQAESFMNAEDARTRSLQLLENSSEVGLDSRRYAARNTSPLRMQVS